MADINLDDEFGKVCMDKRTVNCILFLSNTAFERNGVDPYKNKKFPGTLVASISKEDIVKNFNMSAEYPHYKYKESELSPWVNPRIVYTNENLRLFEKPNSSGRKRKLLKGVKNQVNKNVNNLNGLNIKDVFFSMDENSGFDLN